MTASEKEAKLRQDLRELVSVAIAFSGGVDSTYLLKIATQELGERALAVTAISSTYPQRERERARQLAMQMHARHVVIVSEETDVPEFCANPPNRCYYCKRELFVKIAALAAQEGIAHCVDGSTLDDLSDHRPGRLALQALSVLSPLLDCGFTKAEVRERSRLLELPTWDLPAFACLASRFPYGERITPERLQQIERAEEALHELGFMGFRVRWHQDVARLEVAAGELVRFLEPELRARVVEALKQVGFVYIALDLQGYRTGSMNEALNGGFVNRFTKT